MGAPGAGVPMKFLYETHTMPYFALKCSFILLISVNIGTRAPVYHIIFLRLCLWDGSMQYKAIYYGFTPQATHTLGLGQIFVNNFLNNRQLLEEVE